MGTSKFFLLGQQNTGATTFKDYVPLSSAPDRPKPGKIRTWIDSLGIFNFLPESGPGYKTIVGSQGDLSAPGGSPRGQNATDLQFEDFPIIILCNNDKNRLGSVSLKDSGAATDK